MIEMGLIAGAGLLWSLTKMSWVWRMHILSNPAIMDAIIFIALLLIHWGTFSGVMVATIGAFTCSLILSGARVAVGYVNSDREYVPGKFLDVRHELKAAS